jgi:hypothetical protein
MTELMRLELLWKTRTRMMESLGVPHWLLAPTALRPTLTRDSVVSTPRAVRTLEIATLDSVHLA